MDLAMIAMYLVAVYGTAAIAYSVGRARGARDARADIARRQRARSLEARADLERRSHDSRHARLRAMESRSAR